MRRTEASDWSILFQTPANRGMNAVMDFLSYDILSLYELISRAGKWSRKEKIHLGVWIVKEYVVLMT